jgi:hypothetical protein
LAVEQSVDKPYVYALLDTRDGSIFYIGKGVGNRVVDHIKGRSHSPLVQERISEIRAAGREPDMRVLHFETHEEAYAAETKLIRHVKATQGGLVNRIAGGAGPLPGRSTPSDEYRAEQGEKSRRNWQNPDYRARVTEALKATYTPEKRQRAARNSKALFDDPEHRARVVGSLVQFNQSEEAREIRSAQMRAQWENPETRARMLENIRKVNSDPVTRAQAAAKRKAQWADPETHKKRVAAMLAAHATKWYHVKGLRFGRANEAAQHFGVSVTTIHNWVKAGKAYVEDRNPAQ